MIVEGVINDNLNTVRLQLINGYFYPTNSISWDILVDKYRLERFPEERFNALSANLVRDGYKIAIDGYDPKPHDDPWEKSNRDLPKIGGSGKPSKNYCTKCKANGMCDSDECGRKTYRLFTNK